MSGRKTNRRRGHGGGGEHENSERWLLTYADMMTLLVAFFIMLYAMSVINQAKFQQLAVSVRSGFGGSITTGAPTVISQGGGITGVPSVVSNSKETSSDNALRKTAFQGLPRSANQEQDALRLDNAQKVMEAYIKAHHLQNEMRVSQDERGLIVTVLTDKMLFAGGSADLETGEMSLLDQVGKVINTVPNQVRVEGHTDSRPIHNARFASNWELSAMRAATVVRYFAGRQVAVSRLEEAGFADQHPIAPNDTDADRARNRRVEIVILRQT